MQLMLTHNSKTRFSRNHKNTFGLAYGLPVNGGSCPKATTGKGGCLEVRASHYVPTCYMSKIVSRYPAVALSLDFNSMMLQNASKDEMIDILTNTMNTFVDSCNEDEMYFKIHYSGDIFSAEYAAAWNEVIQEFPEVYFWTYTRSFEFVPALLGGGNLSIYLSCDPVNFKEAVATYDKYKAACNTLALAYMGDNPPQPELYRWVFCPEVTGILKQGAKGACARCRLCLDNYRTRSKNIAFPIHQ